MRLTRHFAFAAVLVLLGCGDSSHKTSTIPVIPPSGPETTGTTPTLTSVSAISSAGGSMVGLKLEGSGFDSTSVTRWNGNDQSTSFVSGTQLSATVAPTDLSTATQISVSVFNKSANASSNSLILSSSRKISPLQSMQTAREFHTSTVLANGKVFIAGGRVSLLEATCEPTASCPLNTTDAESTELFEPSSGVFSSGPKLIQARDSHSATLLADGRVLITGGRDSNNIPVSTAEIYDPETGTISESASAPVAGGSYAFLLSDGRVLLFSGGKAGDSVIAQIYDVSSNSFSNAGESFEISDIQAVAPLPGDKALLMGNGQCPYAGVGCKRYATGVIYDAAAKTFSVAGEMVAGRLRQNAVLTALNGIPKVFVIGGAMPDVYVPINTTEFFDVLSGKFESGPTMFQWRISSAAAVLSDNSVLVHGGLMSFEGCTTGPGELWNPSSDSFSIVPGSDFPGCGPQITALSDGSALITGGWSHQSESLDGAWIYK